MNGRQARAPIEGIIADACDTIGDGDRSQARAMREGLRADARQLTVFTECDGRKARAIIEGRRANARDTIGDGDRSQPRATSEGIRADARTARDHNGFERRGNVTTVILIRRSTEDIAEMRAARSSLACTHEGQSDAFESRAIIEGPIADARDTIGDGDRSQARAMREGIRADARDRIAS